VSSAHRKLQEPGTNLKMVADGSGLINLEPQMILLHNEVNNSAMVRKTTHLAYRQNTESRKCADGNAITAHLRCRKEDNVAGAEDVRGG